MTNDQVPLDSSEERKEDYKEMRVAITVVNITTQTIITKIPIGAPAQAIIVDESEDMIYASYMDQPRIVKIDGKTSSIVNTIDMIGAVTGGGACAGYVLP